MNRTNTQGLGRFAIITLLTGGLIAGCGTGAKDFGGAEKGTSGIRGTASGRIYSGDDSYSYGPLDGAAISFYDVKGVEIARRTTDGGGWFEVILPPGTYGIIPREFHSSATIVFRHPESSRTIIAPLPGDDPPPKPDDDLPEVRSGSVQTAGYQEVVVLPGRFVEVTIDYN